MQVSGKKVELVDEVVHVASLQVICEVTSRLKLISKCSKKAIVPDGKAAVHCVDHFGSSMASRARQPREGGHREGERTKEEAKKGEKKKRKREEKRGTRREKGRRSGGRSGGGVS